MSTLAQVANTNDQWRGKTPRQAEHAFCMKSHICDRCRSRWVPANQVLCDVCVAKVVAYRSTYSRKKTKRIKDKNPFMAKVIYARELGRHSGYLVSILTDVGNLITVHNLHSVDIVDATNGKAKITSISALKEQANRARARVESARPKGSKNGTDRKALMAKSGG